MNDRRIPPILLAGILSAAIAPGLAAQDLPAALQACQTEQADAKRLVCYDREVEAQRQPPMTGPASQAAVPAAASPTPEERFGYNDVLAREARDKEQKGDRALEELVATVAKISTRPDGALVITLANGQVWGQNTPDPYFRLRISEQVRIRPAAFGSFLLSGHSRRSTRVSRLR